MIQNNTKSLWFIQSLRAIACLIVVLTHYLGLVYSTDKVASLLRIEPLTPSDPHLWYQYLFNILTYASPDIQIVNFGLGLFFLISGYIIPFSTKNQTPKDFLIRRFFRIYPTLIICLTITAILIMLTRYQVGIYSIPFSLNEILSNFALIGDFRNQMAIENATWTLEIEVRFYLICFTLMYFCRSKIHWMPYAILAVALFFLSVSLSIPIVEDLVLHGKKLKKLLYYMCVTTRCGKYIIFMFVGTSLYYYDSKIWSGKLTSAMIVALMCISKFCFLQKQNYFFNLESANAIYTSHIMALAVFFILMTLEKKLLYNKTLDKIGDISYALYLTHGTGGYAVYYMIFRVTNNAIISLTTVITYVLITSIAIHKYIEIPSIRLAKKIIDRSKFKPNIL